MDEREGIMMTPRERLLTTLAHKEPDRVPLTAKLWADTLLKLQKHFNLKTDQELFEKMGIDDPVVTAKCLPPRDWKSTPEYVEFCKTIGYEVRSQYVTYEEWGIQRKLGAKGQSVVQQFFFSHHPWES
jgi:hypothetical protein